MATMKVSSNQEQFSVWFKMADKLLSLALGPSDKISHHRAKELLRSSSFLYHSLTKQFSESTATKLLYYAINLGSLLFLYVYATWFMKLLLTPGGLRQLYKVIVQSPLLGIFFFLSFYFRFIRESDQDKLNIVAEALHLPVYKDVLESTFIASLLTRVANLVVENDNQWWGQSWVHNFIRRQVSHQAFARTVQNLPNLPEQGRHVIRYLLEVARGLGKDAPEKRKLLSQPVAPVAVDMSSSFDNREEIERFKAYIRANKAHIKREIKARKHLKSKRELRGRLEQRNVQGTVVCLDSCKQQTKTRMGCYCEGECGRTSSLWSSSSKPWCYVDPLKCKRGKQLPRYLGSPYDFCEVKDVTERAKCFTGTKYRDCTLY